MTRLQPGMTTRGLRTRGNEDAKGTGEARAYLGGDKSRGSDNGEESELHNCSGGRELRRKN